MREAPAQAASQEARKAGFGGGLSEEELELIKQAEREAERQKRIAHTQEMALRRIGKRDLFRGWCAWHDTWARRASSSRALLAAGAKLTRPKLVASYQQWRRDWEIETMARRR